MTERGRRILDLKPHEIDMIMSHPVQKRTVALVADLITQLRAARNSADLYAFQRDLLDATLEAQGRQADATRSLRRERHGRATPSATSGDWTVEQRVWDRVVRQLRTVGDALAWRVFNFDRRFITVLSANSPVSPMTGKTGLAREIEEVERRWHSLRQFSLLHDLTSVIRIGDVTVLTPDGPRLAEIKVNPANRRAGQTRRAERAIAILSGGAPIVTDAEELDLLASATQFSTHLPSVGKAIEAADREGIAWVRIARQLVVAAVSLEAGARLGFEDCQAAATLRKERAFQKAEMHTTAHHLQGDRMDTHTRDRGLAPYTIYPFPPEVCARLTADYLVLKSVIGWDRIADAFRDLGYEASCPFEGCDGQMTLDTPVVNLAKGDRTMTLHAWGLQQVQFEFLTTERFASGVDEMWNCDLGSSDRRSGVLTFGNEKGTWR